MEMVFVFGSAIVVEALGLGLVIGYLCARNDD